jgi:hypothetical protein
VQAFLKYFSRKMSGWLGVRFGVLIDRFIQWGASKPASGSARSHDAALFMHEGIRNR